MDLYIVDHSSLPGIETKMGEHFGHLRDKPFYHELVTHIAHETAVTLQRLEPTRHRSEEKIWKDKSR